MQFLLYCLLLLLLLLLHKDEVGHASLEESDGLVGVVEVGLDEEAPGEGGEDEVGQAAVHSSLHTIPIMKE